MTSDGATLRRRRIFSELAQNIVWKLNALHGSSYSDKKAIIA